MERHVVSLVLLLAAFGCGRTVPHGTTEDLVGLAAMDAGPICVENGDCAEDEVCLDNTCKFFGECLRDFHCSTEGGCVENQCVGEPIDYSEGEPILCEINADCPERNYCVGGACRLGVECLNHAHCDLGLACVGQLCVSAL